MTKIKTKTIAIKETLKVNNFSGNRSKYSEIESYIELL